MSSIYLIGAVASALCLLSNTLTKGSANGDLYVYDTDSSVIFNSMHAHRYVNYLLIGCGICIPIFLEIIIDLISVRAWNVRRSHTIIQLGFVLASVAVVDLIILLWILPFSKAHYLGSVSSVRSILCFTATFAHLKNSGGEIFRGKTMISFAVLGFVGPTLRAYGSVINSNEIKSTIFAVDITFFVLVFCIFSRWFLSLWSKKAVDMTSENLSCSVYLISLFLSEILNTVIIHGLGYTIDPTATPTELLTNGISSTMVVIIISILNGRLSRYEVIQTEVFKYFTFTLFN